MSKMTDYDELGDLIKAAKSGNLDAFEEFYKKTSTIQFYLAMSYVQRADLAQDVVQEIYLRLFKTVENIKDPKSIVSYMNRMNYTISLQILDKEKKEIGGDIYDDKCQSVAYEENKHVDHDETLMLSLEELDENIRRAVQMKYLYKMKVTEIAAVLDVSSRTVLRMLKKGIKQLKTIYIKNKHSSFVFFPLYSVIHALENSMQGISAKHTVQTYNELIKTLYGVERVTSAVSIASAGSIGAKLFSKTSTDSIGSYAIGTLAIGCVVAVPVLTQLNFDVISVFGESYSSMYLEYQVVVKNGYNYNQINVYDEEGDLFTTVKGTDKIRIDENGIYTIEVVGNTEKKRKKIEVDKIDKGFPEIEEVVYSGELIEVHVRDNESQLNLNSIKILTVDGEHIPVQVEKKSESSAVVAFPVISNSKFVVEDCVGNKTIIDFKDDGTEE